MSKPTIGTRLRRQAEQRAEAAEEAIGAALACLPGQKNPHPDDSLQRLVNLARGMLEDPEMVTGRLVADKARLEARVAELEAALEWAVPLAEIALDECRLERLRTGNRDIGKEEGHPGLWPVEVAAKIRARSALSGSPAPAHEAERARQATGGE